ncbi:MAG: prepilin-type N-terminal cleavage/methylation domain-containing protein [bacterium]
MVNKGFSLLEVLISMAIITIGLVAALSLISVSLRSYKTSSEQIIYANEDQECIETARNARDRDPASFFAGASNKQITCGKLTTYLYDWQ